MTPRPRINGVEFGKSGRVLHAGACARALVRANDTSISPETSIIVVVVVPF